MKYAARQRRERWRNGGWQYICSGEYVRRERKGETIITNGTGRLILVVVGGTEKKRKTGKIWR